MTTAQEVVINVLVLQPLEGGQWREAQMHLRASHLDVEPHEPTSVHPETFPIDVPQPLVGALERVGLEEPWLDVWSALVGYCFC